MEWIVLAVVVAVGVAHKMGYITVPGLNKVPFMSNLPKDE